MKKAVKVGPRKVKAPAPWIHALGARVAVTIQVADKAGAAPRPAFGRIVALDQVAVLLDGELEPRAFAPGKVGPP